MQKPLTAEEQDVLFAQIIQKLPGITEPSKLEELALLGLGMMLRRPDDKDLRDDLTLQIKSIVTEVKPGSALDIRRNEMRFAARGCIKVLQAAKKRRLPRHKQVAADNGALSDQKYHGHASVGSRRIPISKFTNMVIAGVVLLALLVGYLSLNAGWKVDASASSEAEKFVQQILQAAQGDAPATHMFGGPLKVSSKGGVPVVTAEGVPPSVCSASGPWLVRKGLLSVNGVTPVRVSLAIITELCNNVTGGATMMWAATK